MLNSARTRTIAERHLRFSSLLQLSIERICILYFYSRGMWNLRSRGERILHPRDTTSSPHLNYANLTSVARATRIDESALAHSCEFS